MAEALAIWKSLGARDAVAWVRTTLGEMALGQWCGGRRPRPSRRRTGRLARRRRRSGGGPLCNLCGWAAMLGGDLDAAEALLVEAVDLATVVGDDGQLASTLHSLGEVKRLRGDLEAARDAYEASLAVAERTGWKRLLWWPVHGLGAVARPKAATTRRRELRRAVALQTSVPVAGRRWPTASRSWPRSRSTTATRPGPPGGWVRRLPCGVRPSRPFLRCGRRATNALSPPSPARPRRGTRAPPWLRRAGGGRGHRRGLTGRRSLHCWLSAAGGGSVRRSLGKLTVLVALSMVAAGCGARFPRSATGTASRSGGVSGNQVSAGAGGDTGTGTATGDTSVAGGATAGGARRAQAAVGGDRAAGATKTATGAAAAPGSVEPGPAPGVTDTAIKIGYLLPLTGAAGASIFHRFG